MRTSLLRIVFGSGLVLLVNSCRKKDLPDPPVNEARFYFSGQVDNDPKRLEAGNDGYFMHTSFYYDSLQGLNVYRGDLKVSDCNSGCGYAVAVLLNDYRYTNPGTATNPDSAFRVGAYVFNDKQSDAVIQTFHFIPEKVHNPEDNYTWKIKNELGEETTYDRTYSVTTGMQVGRTYTVTLNYYNNDGTCAKTLSSVYGAGNPLQARIMAERDTADSLGLTYRFSYTHNGKGKINCEWDFGDQSSKSYVPSPWHKFATGGDFLVNLKLTDSDNKVCTRTYNVAAGGNACNMNYYANIEPLTNSKILKSITVLLTDPAGNVYSSSDISQAAGVQATVVDVVNYINNAAGHPTKAIHLQFQECVLKGKDKSIRLSNVDAVIGVAYK